MNITPATSFWIMQTLNIKWLAYHTFTEIEEDYEKETEEESRIPSLDTYESDKAVYHEGYTAPSENIVNQIQWNRLAL